MNVLYIIPRMTYGGGMSNILVEVKGIRELTANFSAKVVAMESDLSTEMMVRAIRIGLKVILSPSDLILRKLIERADLTVVQYWNCPSMFRFFRFLADSQVYHRLCVSVRVNGGTLPQVVPDWVNASCDALIHIHPRTPSDGMRPGVEKTTIPCLVDLPYAPAPPAVSDFSTFRIFNAGTLNHFKAHPQMIALHEGLQIPDYAFDIWGAGMDQSFAEDLKGAAHANYRGFSSNICADMVPYHLLCNPQTELSYGSFDKIMMESQWMGKPVVVLKNSYIADHVLHNTNGIVAENEYAYRACLEELAADPARYKLLSKNTLEYTRTHYQLTDYVNETFALYQRTIQMPLKNLDATDIPQTPEEAVIDGFGKWKTVLLANPKTLPLIEINYALRCEGGLIQFYKSYPENLALQTHITNLRDAEQSLLHEN